MDIVKSKLGNVGEVDLSFSQGALVLTLNLQDGALNGAVSVKVDSDILLDAVAKAIPGSIDDAIILVIKTALKSV